MQRKPIAIGQARAKVGSLAYQTIEEENHRDSQPK
jgi:hypothetical protein